MTNTVNGITSCVPTGYGGVAWDGYLKYLIDHETGYTLELVEDKTENCNKLSLLSKDGTFLNAVIFHKELPNYENLTYKQLCTDGVGKLVWEDKTSSGTTIQYVILDSTEGVLTDEQYNTLVASRANKIIVENKILSLASHGSTTWNYTTVDVEVVDNVTTKYLCILKFSETKQYKYEAINLDAQLKTHTDDTQVHLQSGERALWNSKSTVSATLETISGDFILTVS